MTVQFVDELPTSNRGHRGNSGARVPQEVLDALRANPGKYAVIPGYKGKSVPPALKRLRSEGFTFVTRVQPGTTDRAVYGAFIGQQTTTVA